MAAHALPVFGSSVAKAPNIERLASNGVTSESAYCASPLCVPSRYAMLTGCYCSSIGAYDNGSEFSATVPTLGYRTCLSGMMHFGEPDQLHGCEDRLATDI